MTTTRLATALMGAVAALAFLAPAPTARAAEGRIDWVDGWAAGQKAAAEAGKILFVYVGRESPT